MSELQSPHTERVLENLGFHSTSHNQVSVSQGPGLFSLPATEHFLDTEQISMCYSSTLSLVPI